MLWWNMGSSWFWWTLFTYYCTLSSLPVSALSLKASLHNSRWKKDNLELTTISGQYYPHALNLSLQRTCCISVCQRNVFWSSRWSAKQSLAGSIIGCGDRYDDGTHSARLSLRPQTRGSLMLFHVSCGRNVPSINSFLHCSCILTYCSRWWQLTFCYQMSSELIPVYKYENTFMNLFSTIDTQRSHTVCDHVASIIALIINHCYWYIDFFWYWRVEGKCNTSVWVEAYSSWINQQSIKIPGHQNN